MKKVNNKLFKTEKETLKKLFVKFLNSLPDFYLQVRKTIPFTVAKIALTNFRINEREAKLFLQRFVELKLLKVVRFRSYKLNFPKVIKLLEERKIKKNCKENGINFEKLEKLKTCYLAFECSLTKNG